MSWVVDQDAHPLVPASNLLSAIVAVMTSRVHCSHTLLGFRLCLLVQASSLSAVQRLGASFVRGHNEGNAAAKLVFDTDCGGIDGNEPLGEALNVSMVNPLLAQPRNAKTTTRRNRFVYPLASLSSPYILFFLLRAFFFVRKFCEVFCMATLLIIFFSQRRKFLYVMDKEIFTRLRN